MLLVGDFGLLVKESPKTESRKVAPRLSSWTFVIAEIWTSTFLSVVRAFAGGSLFNHLFKVNATLNKDSDNFCNNF